MTDWNKMLNTIKQIVILPSVSRTQQTALLLTARANSVQTVTTTTGDA